MQTEVEKTYKIIDPRDRGVYSHVRSSGTERDGDDVAARNAARLSAAQELKQRWLRNYDAGLSLAIIECDAFGRPLARRAPEPAPALRVKSRRA